MHTGCCSPVRAGRRKILHSHKQSGAARLTRIVPRPHAVVVKDQAGGAALDGAGLLAAAGHALREVALHAAADARP